MYHTVSRRLKNDCTGESCSFNFLHIFVCFLLLVSSSADVVFLSAGVVCSSPDVVYLSADAAYTHARKVLLFSL